MAEFWGQSPAGQKWITLEDQLDAALQPVLDLVLDRAGLKPGWRVLDIGCGTGVSVIQAADRVTDQGHVTGGDISQMFLDRATQRAQAAGVSHVGFLRADAQVADLGGPYDAVISRFGVMFFDDPTAALANIARAVKPGGLMTFAAWGQLEHNPWFRLPFVVAVNRLGKPPASDRNAPGPLAFHDRDRVVRLFQAAGLTDVTADAIDMHMTPMGGLDGAAALLAKVGPAVRVLQHFGGSAEDEAAIYTDLRAQIEPFLVDGSVAPVSYTHLRAHETKANLVCRLLLEKKKIQTQTEQACPDRHSQRNTATYSLTSHPY